MKYDVFVSYRRSGGGKEYARTITSELTRMGYNVFLDFKELKDCKFGPQILEAIDSSSVFLFVLSEGALDRCVNADDWVRQEVLYAVEKGKHIVPMNVDGAFKAFPTEIPEEIRKALGDEQHSEVMFGQLFEKSVEKMIDERIEPYVQKSFFRKYRKAIWTACAVVALTVLGFVGFTTLKVERQVKADMDVRDMWMARAEGLAAGEDSLAVAYEYAFKADSLSDTYDGTRFEKRFANTAKEAFSYISHKRDSVFKECSLGYVVNDRIYRENNDLNAKAEAVMYLEKALSAKEDPNLRMWLQILK